MTLYIYIYIYILLRALLSLRNHNEGLRMLWMAIHCPCSPDSTLGMESEETFFQFPAAENEFSPPRSPQTGCGSRPVSFAGDSRTSCPRIKRPGCRAGCSPPSSAEIKNEWSHTSTPSNAFMTCTGITGLSCYNFNSPNRL